jgi:sulfide:quinone oxidoreductase
LYPGLVFQPRKLQNFTMSHYPILIIGGGNAGISLAAFLLRKNKNLNIGIVEPSEKHYYQPAWTLVGAGTFNIKKTEREEAAFIPPRAAWIKDKCTAFQPELNKVTLASGNVLTYDYLVVCPGIQINWNAIKGLPETLGKNGVCSNYSYTQAPYTFECLKNLKKGVAIFHNPDGPVKCGGAPHKIMYLAADYFRKQGVLNDVEIQYRSGGSRLFGIEKYEKTLLKVVERGHIQLHFSQRLVEIDGAGKRARFIGIGEKNKDEEYWVNFDMLHVTPPQGPPDFIKNSPLANEAGWVNVNPLTLQHNKYPNIFALGDSAGLPTAKTGAAVRKQTPVVLKNLFSLMKGEPLEAKYNGYSSCPLVTGYGKLVLAEFGYENKVMETFPFNQAKERWSMYFLKKQILPRLYWNFILKGKMQG